MADIKDNLVNSFQQIQGMKYGARFYKVDLHFHTPSSEDARGKNRYNFNPYKAKYPGDRRAPDYTHQVKTVQETILNNARILADQIVQQFLKMELSLVAVTDHNGLLCLSPG